ncbi:MAG: Stk1 family PASTA domain-containing Ser/Thr kinase [Acidimicrobiales bacterium]
MIPKVLSGRYEPQRLIARGGMAEVYRAHDRLLNRTVALKVLFRELSVDRAFVERFRREAQSAAGLSHHNIVSVYDWGEDGGTYYIVMEYVEGLPLSAMLRTNGPVAPQRAAEIAAEVASALSYAHKHNVVHRDVKPGNVIITEDGQVKVTDFGIARAFNTEDSLTQTGSVMGTATYFSPEQAEGAGVDGRSDLYSLGVVLFEMIAGRPPFVADTPVAVASKHVRENPPSLSDMSPSVPPQFEAIIAKCLMKSPQLRYQSADELRTDLISFAQGREVRGILRSDTTTILSQAELLGVADSGAGTTMALPQVGTSGGGNGKASGGDAPGGDGEGKTHTGIYASVLVVMLLALVVIVALLGQSLGYWHLPFTSSTGSDVTVPRIYGQSASSAEARLHAAGLHTGKISKTPDSHAPSGTVIRSIPAEGQQVSKGATVDLIVSSGKQPTTTTSAFVPGVVGDTLSTAESIIHSAGLRYNVNFIDSTSAANTVLKQAPAKGAQESRGSTIQLYVSNGTSPPPAGVVVPSVTSDSTTGAANTLGKKGFNVSSTYSYNYSSAIANGYVIGTQPPAGSTQPYGSTITLVVSQGPAPATVPNVVGDALSQAESTLTNDGLTPTAVCQSVSKGHRSEAGYVISQSPSAYSQSTAGSSVQITYGAYPSCSTSSSSSTSSTSTTTTTTTTTTAPTTTTGSGLP